MIKASRLTCVRAYSQRRDFQSILRSISFDFFKAEHFEQRVIQRRRYGSTFGSLNRPQKAEFFACQPPDGSAEYGESPALLRRSTASDRKIRFTGTRRADASVIS